MISIIHETTSSELGQFQSVLDRSELGQAPADVTLALSACQHIVQAIESSWQKMEAILSQGEEGRKVRFLLLELRDVIRLAAWGVPQIRQRIQGFDATALASLDEFLPRLNQVSQKLEPILALLGRQPAVDPTRFTSSQEEQQYVSLTDASSPPSLNGGR